MKGVTSEELASYKGNAGAGATGFMWDLGAKAKTAEDVAALRKIGEDASAETKALIKAGDTMGAMKVIGRQPAEAYEYATGVKLDGTPKWEVIEKMAAMKGQTYKPPVPDPQYLKAKGETAAAPEPAKAAPAEINLKDRPVTEAEKANEMYMESNWTHVEDVTDAQGNTIGKIRGNATPGLFQVKGANIVKSQQGKGTYQKVIRQLAEKYGTVQSDTDMQPAAEAAWQKVGGQRQPDGSYKLSRPAPAAAVPAPKGIAASARVPGALKGGEAGAVSLAPLQNLVKAAAPPVKTAVEAVKDIAQEVKETGKETLTAPKMTDYRRSVLNWSAKLQKSFGEAAAAQKDIQTRVPDAVRREAITNWIQAGGDAAVLRQRATATTDPKLRKGYEAALSLTPDELAVANQVKQTYDTLGQRGKTAEVLDNFKDNYVTQIWDIGKTKAPIEGSSRTTQGAVQVFQSEHVPDVLRRRTGWLRAQDQGHLQASPGLHP